MSSAPHLPEPYPEKMQAVENSPDQVVSPSVTGSRAVRPESLSAPEREHLIADIRSIEGERYHERDRNKVRTYLTQSLRSQGWQVEKQPFATGANLIATWPGPNRSPRLLVGAHYDTVAGSPGADDNGTGVAALLEIGRIYAKQAREAPNFSPERTSGRIPNLAPAPASDLMLAFFDREEAGLEGSLAFATPERVAGLRGAIILEMLGFACHEPGCQTYPGFLEQRPENNLNDLGDFIAVVGDAEHPELLEAFSPSDSSDSLNSSDFPDSAEFAQAPVFSLSVPFKGLLMPDVLRSDHAPFWLRGLGAVMVTDTANLRNPHYHQSSDRLETLDLDFFEQVVRQVVRAIAQLQSSLSEPLPR